MWPSTRGLVGLILSMSVLGSASAADTVRSNPRAGIDYYIQTYGRVAPADIPDVYAVFDKVRAVADRSSLVTSQLVVVADAKQASAFALSDGTIFLSKKALAIIRESASAEESQARLAFVLGHELAHLASNDFWDNQISQALLDSSTAKELTGVMDTSAGQQKKELKADDQGFLYAALAGYDVDSLLQTSRRNEDFLSFWNDKAGKRNDANYPQPAQRTSMLRLRLKEMNGALQYFNFGARLMHFGRYREAIGFYREFQRQFPGRELFNNLGYCQLHLAVNLLEPEFAYRYWLPMLSDLDTPLAKLTVRSADSDRKQWRMPAAARENLLQAARNFELAIEKDSEYSPSYVNLAVAQLLLGMDSSVARLHAVDGNHLLHAKIAIDSALKLQTDTQTQMLAAIIDWELQAGAKNQSAQLPLIASSEINNPTVVYNLAKLTGNDAVKSAPYWRQLAMQFDSLPKKMQSLLCSRQAYNADIKARCDTYVRVPPSIPMPWALPMKLSRDLVETPITEAELRQNVWQKNTLTSGTAFVGTKSAVLALDDIATLIVLKRPIGNVDALTQCCAQPLEKIPVVNGTLWHYGRWIALVRESVVEEIWVTN